MLDTSAFLRVQMCSWETAFCAHAAEPGRAATRAEHPGARPPRKTAWVSLNAQADTSLAIVERLERMVVGQSKSAAVVRRTTSAVIGAARTKKLVRVGRSHRAARAAAEQSPEEAIPLEHTGTYGNF